MTKISFFSVGAQSNSAQRKSDKWSWRLCSGSALPWWGCSSISGVRKVGVTSWQMIPSQAFGRRNMTFARSSSVTLYKVSHYSVGLRFPENPEIDSPWLAMVETDKRWWSSKDQKMVNTHEIWGGDPGANAGRDTKADEITLGLWEKLHGFRVCSPLILASCDGLCEKTRRVLWVWEHCVWGMDYSIFQVYVFSLLFSRTACTSAYR